jgi:hypothetical protein
MTANLNRTIAGLGDAAASAFVDDLAKFFKVQEWTLCPI